MIQAIKSVHKHAKRLRQKCTQEKRKTFQVKYVFRATLMSKSGFKDNKKVEWGDGKKGKETLIRAKTRIKEQKNKNT